MSTRRKGSKAAAPSTRKGSFRSKQPEITPRMAKKMAKEYSRRSRVLLIPETGFVAPDESPLPPQILGLVDYAKANTKAEPPATEKAKRDDEGKLPVSRIPIGPLTDVIRVYAHGDWKYGEPWQWRKGIEFTRAYDAVQRHLMAWLSGEEFDRESGLLHLAHAVWGCFALMDYTRRLHDLPAGLDDRVPQAPWDPSAVTISSRLARAFNETPAARAEPEPAGEPEKKPRKTRNTRKVRKAARPRR